MTHRTVPRRRGILTGAILLAACAGLGSSELAQSQPAAPPESELPAGPQSSAHLKRMPWGDPDITGVWTFVLDGSVSPLATADIVHGAAELCLSVSGVQDQLPPEFSKWPGSMVRGTADGEVPYQSWAKDKRKDRLAKLNDPPSEDYVSTSARCLLYGTPGVMLRTNPHVYQFPDHILMIWEYPQMHRIIWTDGRSPPSSEIKLWQGFSSGHWEGDTLVVKTTNQNGFPWMDGNGNIITENTKTTEYIKPGPKGIAYKIVVEDPSVYTKSWWMEWTFKAYQPGVMPAMPPGMPPGAKPPGAMPPGAELPPGAQLPKLDLDAINAMMIGNGEVLEVACVEGERHHTLAKFQESNVKVKR